MKRTCALFIAASLLSVPNVRAQDPVDHKGGNWDLIWSDEFEGAVIDPLKWNFETDCWGGGNDEKQCYTDSPHNAYVKDGILHIVAFKEAAEGPTLPKHMRLTQEDQNKKAQKPFTSARLNTKNKGDWQYGRIEVRAKLPQGQGTWPAIWMLPTDDVYGGWAASGEIDIMEAVNLGAGCESCDGGKENRVLGTLHFGGTWPNNTHKGAETALPYSQDGFHVFAIEWRAEEISWFVDGQPYSSLRKNDWHSISESAQNNAYAPFDQRFHLILNLAIGGRLAEGKNDGGISEAGFPKAMLVDWVRVYTCSDAVTCHE